MSETAQANANQPFPIPLTPLVGRERDVAAVGALLDDPTVRLVTITGPGGVGKTRLAIELGRTLASGFADGVYFVSLASVRDPDLVASAIAAAVGIEEAVDRPTSASLRDELPFLDALVILDNFEQVEAAAPLLFDLLTAGPSLRLLVTSRSVLRLTGEHTYPLAPLAVADPARLPPLAELAEVAAIRLFAERARAATGEFALTAANAEAVATVCARLDGLPLAIELAAARMRHLPLAEIVNRLGDRLGLLVGGPRDLPPRLQTLRAAIDWSYALLEPVEQALFRCLAVFAAGWTLEAATAVATALDVHDDDLLLCLAALVDSSLVTRTPDDGQPRFVMLETIREFGLGQLQQTGELAAARRAYGAYYLDLATRAKPEIGGPHQRVWLDRLTAEEGNLRAVFDLALDAKDADTALRLGLALWRFWAQRGHLREGRELLRRAVALDGGADADTRGRAIHNLGNLALDLNEYEDARHCFERSLAICRELGDQDGIASALNGLGLVARDLGDFDAAAAQFSEAGAIWSTLGDDAGVGIAEFNLGRAAAAAGQYEEAKGHHDRALQIRLVLGDADGVAYSLWARATIAALSGHVDDAVVQYQDSLTRFRDLGDRQGEGHVLYGQARLAQHSGEDLRALRLFHDALELRLELRERNGIVECLEGVAAIVARRGQPALAAKLLAAATSRRATTGAVPSAAERDELEETQAILRQALSSSAFQDAWDSGRVMSLEQAGTEALRVVEKPGVAAPGTVAFDLTKREHEVLVLLREHLTDREIAERLYLSPRTVSNHVASILSKLGVASRREAITVAAEQDQYYATSP